MGVTTPKPGRNDPCHCGSGKKYKLCCLARDEVAASAARQLEHVSAAATSTMFPMEELDELTAASNAIVDLVQAGKLDEAERAAQDLVKRFPEVHDGYDRLGAVYEAKGDKQKAADCYRKVLDVIAAHPADFDPDFAQVYRRLVERLDPPGSS